MKKVLAIAAAGEAATGLVLLVYPPLPIRLLFGAGIAGVGSVMCRIAGIALIALGLACWPSSWQGNGSFNVDREGNRRTGIERIDSWAALLPGLGTIPAMGRGMTIPGPAG